MRFCRNPSVLLDDTLDHLEWRRFPLKDMVKNGWIADVVDLKDQAEEVMRALIARAGGPKVAMAAMFRKNDHRRINAKTDEYALSAWCWEVLARANERPPKARYRPGDGNARLSKKGRGSSAVPTGGPVRAVEHLGEQGIAVRRCGTFAGRTWTAPRSGSQTAGR